MLKACPSIEMGTAAHNHAVACAMDIHAYPMMYKIRICKEPKSLLELNLTRMFLHL